MSQKFEKAAQTKSLNLDNIKVLNYRSSIVIPGQDNIQVEESSSSAMIIGIAVGSGVAVFAVGIIVFSVYRRKQKHKMQRIAKIEACRVQVNPAADQQELDGLAQVSIIQIKENTESNTEKAQNRIEPFESARNNPGPLEKIEEENACQEETLKSKDKEEKDEVQDQRAISFNEIIKKIEAEVNVEKKIELNFEK